MGSIRQKHTTLFLTNAGHWLRYWFKEGGVSIITEGKFVYWVQPNIFGFN